MAQIGQTTGLASRLRAWGLRLLLLVCSGAVAALIGEATLRISGWGQPALHVLVEGEVLKKRPHATYWNRKENLNRVELNSLGFHDREPKFDPCLPRVVFQGDSFVEGEQVPVEALFTSRLREAWTGPNIEILNAGLSGTGTAAQYALWHAFVDPELSPDILILGLFMGNDLENNHPDLGPAPTAFERSLDGEGRIHVNTVAESRLKKLIKKARKFSALVNTVYERLYLLKRHVLNARRDHARDEDAGRAAEPAVPREGEVSGDGAAWGEAIQGTLALLGKWHHSLEQREIPFGVVVIGAEAYFREGSMGHRHKDRFLERLLQLGSEIQMPVLGLRLGDEPRERTYFPFQSSFGHFNPRGHRRAAEEIRPWLESSFPISEMASSKKKALNCS